MDIIINVIIIEYAIFFIDVIAVVLGYNNM